MLPTTIKKPTNSTLYIKGWLTFALPGNATDSVTVFNYLSGIIDTTGSTVDVYCGQWPGSGVHAGISANPNFVSFNRLRVGGGAYGVVHANTNLACFDFEDYGSAGDQPSFFEAPDRLTVGHNFVDITTLSDGVTSNATFEAGDGLVLFQDQGTDPQVQAPSVQFNNFEIDFAGYNHFWVVGPVNVNGYAKFAGQIYPKLFGWGDGTLYLKGDIYADNPWLAGSGDFPVSTVICGAFGQRWHASYSSSSDPNPWTLINVTIQKPSGLLDVDGSVAVWGNFSHVGSSVDTDLSGSSVWFIMPGYSPVAIAPGGLLFHNVTLYVNLGVHLVVVGGPIKMDHNLVEIGGTYASVSYGFAPPVVLYHGSLNNTLADPSFFNNPVIFQHY